MSALFLTLGIGCGVTSERGYYSAFLLEDPGEYPESCGVHDGEPTFCFVEDRCASPARGLCRTEYLCGGRGTPVGEGEPMLHSDTRPAEDWITPCGDGSWCLGLGYLCHEDECLPTQCPVID